MTLNILKATEDNVSELAKVHLASKIAAETGIIDQGFLEAKTQEEYEKKWQGFLASEDSQIDALFENDELTGFVSYGQLRTPPPGTSKIRPLYSSEIFAIYVHPNHFRQGQGTKLLHHAVQSLKQQKHQSMCLWALEKNKRAREFYERMGGKRIGKKMVEFGPTKAKELCYGWRDISVINGI